MAKPQLPTLIAAAVTIALVLVTAPPPQVEAILELLAHIVVVRHGAGWCQEEPAQGKACSPEHAGMLAASTKTIRNVV